MPTVFRKCKVCGVEYPYCKTVVKDGIFRYQDVACCPEHGSIYLQRIIESRIPNATVLEVEDKRDEIEPVNKTSDDVFSDADVKAIDKTIDNICDYECEEKTTKKNTSKKTKTTNIKKI